MHLKRDAFAEQNMKSREHVQQMREKLIFCFWKRLNDSNRDATPHLTAGEAGHVKAAETESSQHEEEKSTMQSETNDTDTPKSKQLSTVKQSAKDDSAVQPAASRGNSQIVSNTGPQVLPPAGIIYRYFVGKGNNSIMVRSLFKNRFWWVQHDKEDIVGCNFCWTQLRKVHIFEALKCKYPHKKSGIKNVNYRPVQE